jgi:hypothetical protein
MRTLKIRNFFQLNTSQKKNLLNTETTRYFINASSYGFAGLTN